MNCPCKSPAHIFLRPGEIVISDKPAIVKTVLGSCISLTMFSSRLKIGAICHCLLPECNAKDVCDFSCAEGARYVYCSVRKMLKELHLLGIRNSEVEVKMFGGADMFGTTGENAKSLNVGEQNIKTALKIMSDANLRLASSDVGGSCGREVIFVPSTGEVFLKKLRRTDTGPL